MSDSKLLHASNPPFPNSVWGVEADVPEGQTVLKRGVGYFDGANYLTINRAQTITSEYKLMFMTTIIPESPDNAEEALYGVPPADSFLMYNATGYVKWRKNSDPESITHPIPMTMGEVNTVELHLKTDSVKIIVNGVTHEQAVISWVTLTWSLFRVGSRNGLGLKATGTMYDISADGDDGLETCSLNGNLRGTRGNDAVLTGSTESVFFDSFDGTSKDTYSAVFDGSGYVDFPSQFDIPDLTAWELEVDLNIVSGGSVNYIGDKDTLNDRILSNYTAGSGINFSDGVEVSFGPGTEINGSGRSRVKFVIDEYRNVSLYLNDLFIETKLNLSSTEITIDNIAKGYSGGANVIDNFYNCKLSINGSEVLNLYPLDNGFIDLVTGTTNTASGTGTTFNNVEASWQLFQKQGASLVQIS